MSDLDHEDLLARLGTTDPLGPVDDVWSWLVEESRRDLAAVKLLESHVDARRILHQLVPQEPVPTGLLAVWAAQPPGVPLELREGDDGPVLRGSKAFCSGASTVDAALVTLLHDDEPHLALVDVAGGRGSGRLTLRPDAWVTTGMARAGTRTIDLDDVPCRVVGGPRAYLDRPGFWHGAIGVAACWHGGTLAVADLLHARARSRPGQERVQRQLGVVGTEVSATWAVLRDAGRVVGAREVDDLDDARRLAESVRAQAAGAARRVLDVVRTELGPGPLAHDPDAARRCEDLAVYVLQHHGDRDLTALGALVEDEERPW